MSLYRLADGVTFTEQPGGAGMLSIRYPQRVLRLSPGGAQAVKILCLAEETGPPGDTVPAANAGPAVNGRILSFAEDMENQGIMVRCFPELPDEELPAVSVVIPTYKRRQLLESCLQSLLELEYPADKLEIIVVDDASPEAVVLENCHPSITLIRLERNGGPGTARNEAVKQATGEIIAFLDDDCLAGRQWLKALVPCFQFPDVAAAGGRVESAGLTRPLDQYEQVQSPLLMGDKQRKVRKGSALSYLATCNLLVRKRALAETGGFEPSMRVGEDVDLCWRLLARGERIYYLPGGVVYHHHRSEMFPFLKRRYNYGQSEAKLHSRCPDEKRKLPYYPGNHFILLLVILAVLRGGLLCGLAAGSELIAINLLWQSLYTWKKINKGSHEIGLWNVLKAAVRSQGAAFYLYSQHFSRYYSISAGLIFLFIFPRWAPLILGIQALPCIVDYRIKKPSLNFVYYLFFHFWEDVFYQAGVFRGCLTQKNWRPLTMDFIRADGRLFGKRLLKTKLKKSTERCGLHWVKLF